MLSRLLGRNKQTDLTLSPSVPEGMRVYVVGDIHGRADLLERQHDLIDADFAGNTCHTVKVVYLGDYIDRGPDSARVLERLSTRHADFVEVALLRGNHEEMLLRFLIDPSIGPAWRQLGGLETLQSYGIDVDATVKKEGYPGLSQRLNQAIPSHHLALLERLEASQTIGDYFFCHAGVRPGVPLEQQRAEDLTWIRSPFLEATGHFGKMVVHGHSPTNQPDFRHNRINIDTKAYSTGRLTCLVLEGTTQRILST